MRDSENFVLGLLVAALLFLIIRREFKYATITTTTGPGATSLASHPATSLVATGGCVDGCDSVPTTTYKPQPLALGAPLSAATAYVGGAINQKNPINFGSARAIAGGAGYYSL